jgi:hypothetical protein
MLKVTMCERLGSKFGCKNYNASRHFAGGVPEPIGGRGLDPLLGPRAHREMFVVAGAVGCWYFIQDQIGPALASGATFEKRSQ